MSTSSFAIAFSIFSFLFHPSLCLGQVTQHGYVKEISSNYRPIVAVQVRYEEAPITASNKAGEFELVFARKRPGDIARMVKIYKDGYVVVNDLEINERVLTEKAKLKIVMSLESNLIASKKKY